MKRFVKYLSILLVLAGVLPFLIKGKDGQSLMKMEYLSAPKVALPDSSVIEGKIYTVLQEAREKLKENRQEQAEEVPGEIYKWQDAEGKWVFSDQPNPAGPNQRVSVNPNLSTIPTPQAPDADTGSVTQDAEANYGLALPSLMTVSIGEIPQLLDDAKEVKKVIESRYQTLPE